MKILVLNSGSSSLKYQVIDMNTEECLASGKYERIGEKASFLVHKVETQGKKIKLENTALNHAEAIEFTLKQLVNPEYAVVTSLDEITATGHRVVHGGEFFKESVVITDEVMQKISEYSEFAPLHNPAAILGMEACKKVMPGKKMVAVFDTTFHQTIAKEKFIYSIPYEYYEKYGVRKYGFHGTSHMYVSNRLAEIVGKDIKDLKIITCHIGQGASICAVEGGKSIDTSMGLTPLAGVTMVTRSGDIDPSVITYLMNKEQKTAKEMEDKLNKESGVAGISGLAPDFREIEEEARNGNQQAKIAVENFVYSVSGYIAKYCVALKGVDYIVFTGGIGENQITIRKAICDNLSFIGLEMNEENNKIRGEEIEISSSKSKVGAYVIPTNEELVIAKETVRLI